MVQVTLIAAVLVLFTRLGSDDGGPWLDLWTRRPGLVALMVNGGLLAAGMLVVTVAFRAGRRIDRGRRGAIVGADRWATGARLAGALVFVLGVALLGWLDVVRGQIGDWVLIDEAVAITPLLLVLILMWWAMAPIELRLREAIILRRLDQGLPPPVVVSRARHVVDQVRHETGPVLVPLIPMLAWGEVVVRAQAHPPGWLVGVIGKAGAESDAVYLGALLAGMAVVFACAPLMIRMVWSTTPIGLGETRSSIDEICRRHRVRVRDVLMWRTRSSSPNAMVMGALPGLRYVLLSDLLLDALPARAVEAVAAHEVAHVRRRHIPWLVVSVMSTVALLVVGVESVMAAALGDEPTPGWFDGLVTVLSLGAVLVVIAWISKRFEWQADAFAAQHLSGYDSRGRDGSSPVITHEAAATMAGALLQVAALAGMDPERSTWRHGSIATRVERLRRLVGVRCAAAPIDATVRRLKRGVLLVLVVTVAIGAWLPGDGGGEYGGDAMSSP